jgi:hypothetical protein
MTTEIHLQINQQTQIKKLVNSRSVPISQNEQSKVEVFKKNFLQMQEIASYFDQSKTVERLCSRVQFLSINEQYKVEVFKEKQKSK